jgi:flagellar hook-associated protein 3 FlgL
MRITENSQYRDALANLEQTAETVAKYQNQVSTGKRLNTPSDDPQSAGADVGVHADLATLDRYTSADKFASAALSVADSTLSDMINQLNAAKTAALSAAGSTTTDSQRQAAVATLQSVKQALLSDYNATFQGTYLFSGTKSTTAPYTQANGTVSAYQGNSNITSVDVGTQTAIPVTLDGQAVAQGSDTNDVFSQIDTLIAAIQAGDTQGIKDGMAAIGNAFNRVVQAQTSVGASLNRLDSQTTRLTAMSTAAKAQISALEDADLAEAIIELQKAQTAQQSAIGALATTAQRKTLMDYIA